MTRFLHIVDILNEWTGRLVSFFLIPLFIVVLLEIALRAVFGIAIDWGHELAQFLFGTYFILTGGYVLYRQSHIKVEILHQRVSPRAAAIINLLTSVLFFTFCSILLWRSGKWALESLRMFEHSPSIWAPPIYPIKLCVPFGTLLFLLQGITEFIRNFIIALSGKSERVTKEGIFGRA